jgi:hypothetical protein
VLSNEGPTGMVATFYKAMARVVMVGISANNLLIDSVKYTITCWIITHRLEFLLDAFKPV